MRHLREILVLGLLPISGLWCASAQAAPLACADVAGHDFGIAGLQIDTAEAVKKGDDSPADHCLVRGVLDARTGADGKAYAVSFELRLPDDWNARFVHQFNGGNDGAVVPAFGPLLGGDKSDTALGRGYAVVSSDSGHDGSANPDAGLAGGARFGFDAEARSDYGYSAVEKLNPVALKLVEAYYDKPIAYSYGVGGSNGGRHAMVEAARMPAAFDGLLVGYPGFDLPRAALQHAWDVQTLKPITGDLRTAFSRPDLDAVADGILKACDGLDGLEDGIIADPDACQATFDPASVVCTEGQNGGCISQQQVEALERIVSGPHNSAGEQLYVDWMWDRGIASGNWRFWKLESPIPPWDHLPLIAVMGSASLAQIFTTPPTKVDGTPEALEQYLLNFDFDTDAPKIHATTADYPESAMEFMTPPGMDDPKLQAFRDAGGRMIVFHGVSDPVFSIVDTTNWYEKLDANNEGQAGNFVTYYRVPGMPHGAGGPSTDDFDMFTALVNWVEHGEKPGPILAGVTAGNEEAQAALGDITRKLCPYPQVMTYVQGDPSDAGSFDCK